MDRKLNIIDCPGFCGSLFSAFKVGDVGVVFLFNAQNGWESAAKFRPATPVCCRAVIGVVNQLDRQGQFRAAVEVVAPRRA